MLTFIIVMIVVVHLHPDRGRQHPRPGGGLSHGKPQRPHAAAATGPGGRPKAQEAGTGPKTPWWMWIAVAAIVVFCLFPFYWLVNLSLKTGADLSATSLIPPNPSLDNYESIFQNDDFVRALREQRDRVAGHDDRWRSSSARSAPTRSRACASRASS